MSLHKKKNFKKKKHTLSQHTLSIPLSADSFSPSLSKKTEKREKGKKKNNTNFLYAH
jgi:hypothetical protein